jgi:transcriptional regulator with XRE-family HTH domain
MSQNTAVDELNTYNFIIAGNIRHYLEANHLTQKQAAELSGLKHSTINSWVTGRNFPRPEKLSLLATVLGVPVLEFYQKHPEDAVYQTVGERRLITLYQENKEFKELADGLCEAWTEKRLRQYLEELTRAEKVKG